MIDWYAPHWKQPFRLWVVDECLPVTHIGPYSRGRSNEHRVIGAVVEWLMDQGYGLGDIKFEYRLTLHDRVDVAVPSARVFVECKGVPLISSHLRQAERYLDRARAVWPSEPVAVYLVGPSVSPRLRHSDVRIAVVE